MKKSLNLFIVILSFSINVGHTQKTPDRVPYKLFDDFETGELFGWEPYPYAEDIGSNRLFFSHTSPTYKNSRYSLAALVRANDAVELYQGFTKRLNLWTVHDTHVRMALYFQSDRNPESLEISLGTADGRLFRNTIHTPKANQWLDLNIPVDSFHLNGHPLMANEQIQVVTIKASYSTVYWLNTYTILMDNFMINGESDRRFITKKTVSNDFKMFDMSILNKHFFYGDNFGLDVAPEGKVALKDVSGTLINSKGEVIKENIPFAFLNNEWSNESIYTFKNGDAAGQWEIKLAGKTAQNTEIKWGFRFLMPGKHITGYPRLFFSEQELRDRLKNESSVVAKQILNKALANKDFLSVNIDSINEGEDKTSENLVGGPYAKYSAGVDAAGLWLNPMKALQDIIQDGSFRYAFVKDTVAGEKAKKALLKLCSFSKWNNNWMLERKFWTYYPVGYALTSVAYGYDMLHDILSENEKSIVRNAIMEKGIKLFYRDMVEMNRMPSNITNHIAVLVSGSLLAATAIYGEDPANPYMEPYLSGIIAKAKTFIDRAYYEDGSYAEPKSGYMNMASRAIVELLATLERNFGVDYSTATNVQNFYKYPLQATHSNGTIQDFGDGNTSYKAFTEIHSEWFVHRTANPYLYNYIKPYWETGNGGYMGYLWYRDDIKPLNRSVLPTSKVFNAQGMVMRSGWNDSSTIISIHVGPNGNHAHLDQGSFQIMTNGEELLTDAGIGAGGYYKNLEYLVYNVQAIAHNVMLIDHDPESQAPGDFDNGIKALQNWPTVIKSFAGEIADAFESELSGVYKNKLETYTRTLLYTKTGPLFLFDRIKSKNEIGHTYNWLFHAPQKGPLNALPNYTGWFDKKDAGTVAANNTKKRDETNLSTFRYADQRLEINRANARLTMDIVWPKIESISINDKVSESYIKLNSKPKQTEASLLAVILPEAKPIGGNYNKLPVITRINASGWIGAKVERAGAIDFGFFRTVPGKGSDTIHEFHSDADQFTVSYNGSGKLQKVFFDGSFFSSENFTLKSTGHILCAVSPNISETAIEIVTENNTNLVISMAVRPSEVILNSASGKNWQYDNHSHLLTLAVRKGKSNFIIK